MSNNLFKFHNGICGYAPQGSIGSSGSDGYSVYYSSFDSSDDSKNNMILLIKQKKILSTNPNYGTGQIVNYKIGDVIITIDSMMLSISGDKIDNCTLLDIGSIKIISNENGEGKDIFNGNNIEYEINHEPTPKINDYNYIENGSSPLYHHRDTNDRYCYGNSIHLKTPSDFTTYLNKMDNHMCTLVLNFASCLRLEKIINSDNYDDNIFIDNRYLYPYGHTNNYIIWSNTNKFESYDDEISDKASNDLKDNLTTTNDKCICDGYISFYVNNNQYIKKIIISV